jgi:hypothetical protein
LPSCTLEIAGRIVVRAEGGPFDAEYVLFEAHEIELRANKEPGNVREHGYATTVALARGRLDAAGATAATAEAVAGELGALVSAYARGAEVRRVASLLGPCELFEGRSWTPQAKRYEGAWLDLVALASDLGVEHAGRALQVLFLAALLRDTDPEAGVVLTTADYTSARRAGERTHKRVSLGAIAQLAGAIHELSEHAPDRSHRDAGPPRSELLEWVRARKASCDNPESTAKLESLERALSVRERPARGPLAEPEAWAIEQQLNERDTQGVAEKLDALERTRGRQPGSTYLRARLALMLGTEDARAIAERASSLALSMSAFAELELLAAEAWSRAGEKKRALAYARDLADNSQVDVTIRARARELVEPVGSPSGERPASVAPPPMTAQQSVAAKPMTAPPSGWPAARGSGAMPSITAGRRESADTLKASSFGPHALRSAPPMNASKAPTAPAPRPARADDDEPVESAPDTPIEPVPIVQVRGSLIPMAPEPPAPASFVRASQAPPAGAAPADETHTGVRMRTEAPPRVGEETLRKKSVLPPQAYPTPAPPAPPTPREVTSARPPPRPPSSPDLGDDDDDEPPPAFVKGGSLPPYRTEPPPANFPPAPLVPTLTNENAERAEALSLPPGLHGESVTSLPTNPWEARIYFTQLSRELGRLYRTKLGVELRTDIRSIEILQRNLAEHFETGELKTPEDEREVRLHGAFLSEILARRLGAEWTDLGVSEMGYWAMNVPPGTRVWPIGRVVRYVTMQHRERDLVSYFLELQARASGLR